MVDRLQVVLCTPSGYAFASVRDGGAWGAKGRFGVAGERARSGHAAPGSGRQLDGAAGEECSALLVGIPGRQRDLDPGLQLGNAGGDPRVEAEGRLLISASRWCRPQALQKPIAAVWIRSRNGLAVALEQEVRSEARCSLCALIRRWTPPADGIDVASVEVSNHEDGRRPQCR